MAECAVMVIVKVNGNEGGLLGRGNGQLQAGRGQRCDGGDVADVDDCRLPLLELAIHSAGGGRQRVNAKTDE